MYCDIKKLIQFYSTPLGNVSIKLIENQIKSLWPEVKKKKILGLGYTLPWLEKFKGESNILFAAFPSSLGGCNWSSKNFNQSILVDDLALPFSDLLLDKVIIVHALEMSYRIDILLDEVWRVLDGQGKIILIVPNTIGLWSRKENNPFGLGRPFSKNQIKALLSIHGFNNINFKYALHFPPTSNRLILNYFDNIEKFGNKLFAGMGGVMIIEATKFNYAISKPNLKSYIYKTPKGIPSTARIFDVN